MENAEAYWTSNPNEEKLGWVTFNIDNCENKPVLIKPRNLNSFLFIKDHSRSCELETIWISVHISEV